MLLVLLIGGGIVVDAVDAVDVVVGVDAVDVVVGVVAIVFFSS